MSDNCKACGACRKPEECACCGACRNCGKVHAKPAPVVNPPVQIVPPTWIPYPVTVPHVPKAPWYVDHYPWEITCGSWHE